MASDNGFSTEEDATSSYYGETSSDEGDSEDSFPSTHTQQRRGCCARQVIRDQVVKSEWFQMVVAAVILLNTLVMALQTDIDYVAVPFPKHCVPKNETSVSTPTDDVKHCKNLWDIFNVGFLVFFIGELAFRFRAFSCRRFWCGFPDDGEGEIELEDTKSDVCWNMFDVSIVTLALFDFVSAFFLKTAPSKIITIIRTARILRILRVLRIFKSLKQLAMLVRGLVESFAVVIWIMALLGIILFVSAIFCTNLIGHSAKLWGDKEPEIEEYWGSVYKSFVTLFQFLTLDDWAFLSHRVAEQMPGMQIFFIIYVVFASFVILSLLTGVMADHMNEVREDVKDDEAEAENEEFRKRLDTFYDKYADARVHQLSLGNFKDMFEDKELKAELKKIRVSIDSQETETLFDALDMGRRGYVSREDFRIGMCEIKADLSAKHIFELHSAAKRAYNEVKRRPQEIGFPAPPAECERAIQEAEDRMSRMEEKVEAFEAMLRPLIENLEVKKKYKDSLFFK